MSKLLWHQSDCILQFIEDYAICKDSHSKCQTSLKIPHSRGRNVLLLEIKMFTVTVYYIVAFCELLRIC